MSFRRLPFRISTTLRPKSFYNLFSSQDIFHGNRHPLREQYLGRLWGATLDRNYIKSIGFLLNHALSMLEIEARYRRRMLSMGMFSLADHSPAKAHGYSWPATMEVST